MAVYWAGQSPYWRKPRRRLPVDGHAFALVEAAVLDVAFDPRYNHLRRLSKQAALNCSSRCYQRSALDPSLNPAWEAFHWRPGVLKAPTSRANAGVVFCRNDRYLERLRAVWPGYEGTMSGIWEEFIEGEAWEVDGYAAGTTVASEPTVYPGLVHTFHPLRQHWNRANDRILRYERAEPPLGIGQAVRLAVRSVGLMYSPFCVELRYTPRKEWKVIEIHARLGEDRGLARKMWPRDPLRYIEELAGDAHAEGTRPEWLPKAQP